MKIRHLAAILLSLTMLSLALVSFHGCAAREKIPAGYGYPER